MFYVFIFFDYENWLYSLFLKMIISADDLYAVYLHFSDCSLL